MGIVILIIFIFLFEAKLKKYDSKFKIQAHAALLLYVIFSIILSEYLIKAYNWENGIPGADLTAYYNVAKEIVSGTKFSELYKINHRFVYSISGFGYMVYSTFIGLVSFSPTIINTRISLQILYIIQCIVAIISAINIAEFFGKNKKEKKAIMLLFLSCVCVSQMASVLMRDIWIVFFISLLLNECKKEAPNKIYGAIIIIICFLLRAYTIFITIPVFIMYFLHKKKLAVTSSFAILGVFVIGQEIVTSISSIYNIEWNYDFDFDISSIIKFIFFPNIISQTSNVQNMVTGYHAKFGGNTEWIYYLLSCWNLYVYPIVGLGILKLFKNKEKRDEKILWLFQIINISLLYAVFYNSISEPRHKLLILYSLVYFFIAGFNEIKAKYKFLYFINITLIILLLFLMVS